MPITATAEFVKALAQLPILEPAQRDELTNNVQAAFSDAKSLANELVRRGWLTRFQTEQILEDKTVAGRPST